MEIDPAAADQGAAPQDTAEEQGEGAGGYTIEITVAGDGSITVGVETAEYESAEEQGAQQAGAAGKTEGKPVSGIREALKEALTIYENNGEMAEGNAEDQMMQGFKGANGGIPQGGGTNMGAM